MNMMNYLDKVQIIQARSQLTPITIQANVKSRKLKGVKISIQKPNTLIN